MCQPPENEITWGQWRDHDLLPDREVRSGVRLTTGAYDPEADRVTMTYEYLLDVRRKRKPHDDRS